MSNERRRSRLVSWDDFERASGWLYRTLKSHLPPPELICGLSRGGLPLAVRLSHLFDAPLIAIDPTAPALVDASEYEVIFLVDDIYATGTTAQRARDHLMRGCGAGTATISVVTWHGWPPADESGVAVSLVFAEEASPTEWIVYPWEGSAPSLAAHRLGVA
jgi:hypoxanthine phosphoribosyltransferase